MQIIKCIGVSELTINSSFRYLLLSFYQSAVTGKLRCIQEISTDKHWLDYADTKYSSQLVKDIKILLNILVILGLMSMFWAINEQTSSLFPLQATRMNGDLGFYTVKPDQMQLFMQLLVMGFLPLCDLLIYPMLRRVGIKTLFQKISLAGLVSFGALVTAGFLEMQIAAVTAPLHMIWILPQVMMLALVEAVVGVLGLVFASSEAPESLKTVMQAAFLATHGMGNFYDVVVFSLCSFSNQAREDNISISYFI